jgi:hypothetical protein
MVELNLRREFNKRAGKLDKMMNGKGGLSPGISLR